MFLSFGAAGENLIADHQHRGGDEGRVPGRIRTKFMVVLMGGPSVEKANPLPCHWGRCGFSKSLVDGNETGRPK